MTEPETQIASRLSVIMVSYNTGPALFQALESVLADPLVHELVLVNHENPRADVQRIVERGKGEDRLIFLNTGANLGFSRGCNLGAEEASGDVFLFLNPDAELAPGAVAQILETLRTAHEPVIVGARILHPDGSEQRGGRRGELTIGSAFQSFLGLGREGFHKEGEALPEAAIPVAAVSGAAMALTRDGFNALSGFDEGYFLHVEDLDICRRARDAGGQVLFEPRAEVRHVGGTSKVSRFKVEHWKAAGLVRYFNCHGGAFGPLKAFLAAPLIWGALMARAGLSKLRG